MFDERYAVGKTLSSPACMLCTPFPLSIDAKALSIAKAHVRPRLGELIISRFAPLMSTNIASKSC